MRVKNVYLRPIGGISSRLTVKIICVLLSLHPYSVSKHANNQEISTKHPNTRVFCRFKPVFKSLGLRKSLHLLLCLGPHFSGSVSCYRLWSNNQTNRRSLACTRITHAGFYCNHPNTLQFSCHKLCRRFSQTLCL